jgi:transcriptional regulator with XRE-family HTH domain
MKYNRFAARFGAALLKLRQVHGLRQDDVARAARTAGLPWTRSVVVALEAGRRDLSIDECAYLPVLLRHLGLGDRLRVSLESDGVDPARFCVEAVMDLSLTFEDPEKRRKWDANWERLRNLFGPSVGEALAGTMAAISENQALYVAAGADLEQKVGRRVRLDPFVVAWTAHRAWGRSLTEERDRRVAEQAPAGAAPRAVQALRGHVTRALLEEFKPLLAGARAQLRRKKTARR